MKKIIVLVALLTATISAPAQNYNREGNTFTTATTQRDPRAYADSTKYTWVDARGTARPIWVARTGSCFVIRTSKEGKQYRQYCPREMSATICKELGREYKPSTRKEAAK